MNSCLGRIFGLGLVLLLCWGCTKSGVDKVAPEQRGQRGENCAARNDCQSGLACIGGICSKNDFEITATAKQCDQIDCADTEDCCGDRPTEAPAKCAAQATICNSPTLPGCLTTICDSDSDCGGGSCGFGQCSNGGFGCDVDGDCADICLGGQCNFGGTFCDVDADCSGTCQSRTCNCSNPNFDQFDPICSDPDCQDICIFICDEERCLVDDSCETDLDCPFNARFCDNGSCVVCMEDDDCDSDAGEKCLGGSCERPCKANEECPLFSECTGGECVETGCRSDRECVLAASGGAEDARLSMCLPSDTDPGINICKIPCENDGACGSQFQVCDAGFCKFIGCETDEECRGFLGLANEQVDDLRPFVSMAVCRE